MNYHYRDIAVKEENECTLENLLGLTALELELVEFGVAQFNPARSDRWPEKLKARRRQISNNLKNATALRTKGSSSAEAHEARLLADLHDVTHEARELHRQGELLASRLEHARSAWDDAQRSNSLLRYPLSLEQLAKRLWEPATLERLAGWRKRESYRQRHRARRVPHLWSERYSGSDASKIGTLVPQKRKPWDYPIDPPVDDADLFAESLEGLSPQQANAIRGEWVEFQRRGPAADEAVEPARTREEQFARLSVDQKWKALECLSDRLSRASARHLNTKSWLSDPNRPQSNRN